MDAEARRARQAAALEEVMRQGGDALLVSHLPNIRYLSGFTGSAGLLLLHARETVLVTDFRYAEQAPPEVGDCALVAIDRTNVWERLGKVLGSLAPRALAVEATSLSLRDAERLTGLGRFAIVPVRDVVEALRASKAPAEVEAIRRAAVLAQEALAATLPGIAAGMTEREVAARLEHELRVRGSDWHPFQTIVASGPRAALPHARTSSRTLARGDLLLLDFGAEVDGYCADLTRMAVVGAPASERQREVHAVVREAQAAAIRELRPGLTGAEGDALARTRIAEAGFGDAFGHSLGHGLGLEVHEAPRLAPTAGEPLPEGAVVTVEPGIYLPGWGGVRLEDDVHLVAGGARLLSDQRTELLELA